MNPAFGQEEEKVRETQGVGGAERKGVQGQKNLEWSNEREKGRKERTEESTEAIF